MSKPILYTFRRCPYAIRARMALVYARVDFECREISLKNKPQSLFNYSAKGTVPVLIDNELIIDESLSIMLWALDKNDTDKWIGSSEQLALINVCDTKFKPQLDQYKYADRHELTQIEYREQALWFLILLNDKLKQQKFLFSDYIGLADNAIFPFIRQFAFVDKGWFDQLDLSKLQKWLTNHLESKLFKTVMKKNSLWEGE